MHSKGCFQSTLLSADTSELSCVELTYSQPSTVVKAQRWRVQDGRCSSEWNFLQQNGFHSCIWVPYIIDLQQNNAITIRLVQIGQQQEP